MQAQETLRKYFGHEAFRPGQEVMVNALTHHRDALGVMPTGGGKSLCYQIPALLLPGITLVVSPLISLMKDQVAALKSAGVPAAYINSSLTGEQIRTVYARTRKGAYKLIYVAPRAAGNDQLVSALMAGDGRADFPACRGRGALRLAVGTGLPPECTCGIADFVDALPHPPGARGAFTATATEQRAGRTSCGFLQPAKPGTGSRRASTVRTSTSRCSRPKNTFPPSPPSWIFAAGNGARSGIVYCATRKAVEQVCDS